MPTRFLTPLLIAALCTPALAIKPQKWTHTTEADFDAGEAEGVVITSLGDVKLSRATTQVASLPEESTIIFDMQDVGGVRYLAAGPEGVIYRVEGDEVKEVLRLEGEQVFALDVWQGKLLMAVSGETSRVAVLDGEEATTVLDLPGVRYVWDVLVDSEKGGLILATGVEGRVLHVDVANASAAYTQRMADEAARAEAEAEAEGEAEGADDADPPATLEGEIGNMDASPPTLKPVPSRPDAPAEDATGDEAVEAAAEGDQAAEMDGDEPVEPAGDEAEDEETDEEGVDEAVKLPDGVTAILDTAQANVLCLARDDQGRIFAGTDTDGLVYRLTYEGEAEDLPQPDPVAADDEAEPDAGDADGEDGEDGDAAEDALPATGPRYTAFVLYDAAEPEIGAIALGPNGTVYAGTADAEGARPGRLEEASAVAAGRPGSDAVEAAAPTTPPEADPGEAPAPPDPGEVPQLPPDADPIGDGDPGEAPVVPDPEPTVDPAADPAPPMLEEPDGGTTPDGTTPDGTTPDGTTQESEPAASDASQVTSQQLDQLRQAIRDRLDAARKTGEMQIGPGGMGGQGGGRSASGESRSRPPRTATQESAGGNAVYRIDPQGFVSEVFRESVMILRIVPTPDGRLLIGTGNEGQVYSVDPAAEETTILADIESEQIPAMMIEDGGRVLLGAANPARILTLEPGVADTGTFTSPVMDASNTSLFGTLNLTARIPDGATLAVETRTGNVGDPDEAAWSDWSQAGEFTHDADRPMLQPLEARVASPPARYLQYRLSLQSGGDAAPASPTVEQVELAYIVPNIRPSITSIQASYNEVETGPNVEVPPAPDPTLNVTWEAADANTDGLTYTLDYMQGGDGKPLTIAVDLTDTNYAWNTRTVPDGRYLLRVTASDAPDNPGSMARTANRRSDPVLIDNTPPTLDALQTNVADGSATLTGTARDALAGVASIAYTVDSDETYEAVLPQDLIFDSTSEPFEATISDLEKGDHIVTLRIRDTRGNTLYENLPVTIE